MTRVRKVSFVIFIVIRLCQPFWASLTERFRAFTNGYQQDVRRAVGWQGVERNSQLPVDAVPVASSAVSDILLENR